MKKIILIALVAVLCVGTAYASKLEVTGSAFYRGRTVHNYGLDTESSTQEVHKQAFYDYEMTVYPKFVVDENNFAIMRLEIKDMTAAAPESAVYTTDSGNNVRVERSYFQTKIGPTSLALGLMDGGAWGTAFGDTIYGAWRIKAITTTPIGSIVTVLQRNYENSSETAGNDYQDNTVYYLGLVTKAGPMYIKPLFVYADYGDHQYNGASSTLGKVDVKGFQLAGNGAFGDINVEFEFGWADTAFDATAAALRDNTLWGLYVDANMKMGDSKFGATFAYGSTDKSEYGSHYGYTFGDEISFGEIIAVDMELGENDTTDDTVGGMAGFTAVKLYADFVAMENLTISPVFVYAKSNYDDGANVVKYNASVEIESAMELDLWAKYQINDAVYYKAGFCYAQTKATKFVTTDKDPDDTWKLVHMVGISF